MDVLEWKSFGQPAGSASLVRSNESKANETDDYRRDVNLSRDTCDATRRKPGEKEKESGASLAVVSPRGQRVIITNWTVRIIAAKAV